MRIEEVLDPFELALKHMVDRFQLSLGSAIYRSTKQWQFTDERM